MGGQATQRVLRGFLICEFTPLCTIWGCAGWNIMPEVVKHGSAHCWVLRRHLLLVGVFSGRSRPWAV
jgi:hypothetical protein